MADGSDVKPKLEDPLTTASESPVVPDSCITESLTEFTSFSEQISTEDTEISSTDVSVNPNKAAEDVLHKDPKGGVTRGVSICSPPCSVEKEQPKPLCALLPSSKETCTIHEVTQSFTSISRSPDLKTTAVHTEPDPDDLCAAILLACLFCHPLDCFLASMRGCNECLWSLCSSLCGCEPTALRPLLDIARPCDPCGCLGARCFLCDCPACDVCLQATECLDLAMEISQMLYH